MGHDITSGVGPPPIGFPHVGREERLGIIVYEHASHPSIHPTSHAQTPLGLCCLFVGFVCRTKTMHQLLCFKSRFPNHFMFTHERYLSLILLVQLIQHG